MGSWIGQLGLTFHSGTTVFPSGGTRADAVEKILDSRKNRSSRGAIEGVDLLLGHGRAWAGFGFPFLHAAPSGVLTLLPTLLPQAIIAAPAYSYRRNMLSLSASFWKEKWRRCPCIPRYVSHRISTTILAHPYSYRTHAISMSPQGPGAGSGPPAVRVQSGRRGDGFHYSCTYAGLVYGL